MKKLVDGQDFEMLAEVYLWGGWLKLDEAGGGKKRMEKVPMLGEVVLGRVRLGEEE